MPFSSNSRRIVHAFHRPAPVAVTVDDRRIQAVPGESLAAALLVAGVAAFRTSVRAGEARGPVCMMGVCQECLVDVDGALRQACLVSVQEGLVVRTRSAGIG